MPNVIVNTALALTLLSCTVPVLGVFGSGDAPPGEDGPVSPMVALFGLVFLAAGCWIAGYAGGASAGWRSVYAELKDKGAASEGRFVSKRSEVVQSGDAGSTTIYHITAEYTAKPTDGAAVIVHKEFQSVPSALFEASDASKPVSVTYDPADPRRSVPTHHLENGTHIQGPGFMCMIILFSGIFIVVGIAVPAIVLTGTPELDPVATALVVVGIIILGPGTFLQSRKMSHRGVLRGVQGGEVRPAGPSA